VAFGFAVLFVAAVGLIAFGVVLLKRAGPGEGLKNARSRPNVVLVILDALRADRVYAQRNGVPLMPYLSRLTQECVRFPNAMAPSTLTRPSMTSIFTSLYVDTHQVYYGSDALPPARESMAAFLKKAGYNTFGVHPNGNLTRELGYAQGFDQYEYLPDAKVDVITSRALEWLQNLPEPFFLYVHYLAPHLPYVSPDFYHTLLGFPPPGLDPAERAIAEDFMDYFWDFIEYKMGTKTEMKFAPLSPLGKEAVRMLYEAKIRYADDEVSKFLDALHAKYPNTLLIVIADHGEHLWDHDYLGHGLTMYEEELRVPFFMKCPGLEPRTVDGNVNTIDILPTVAALLGIPPNPVWQGQNLFAPRETLAPVFSHTHGPREKPKVDSEMVRVGSMKLIRNLTAGTTELYDVDADPHEKADLAPQRPKQVEQLAALLDAHDRENVRARGRVQQQSVAVSEETRRQLHDIGYDSEQPDEKK
jgi:arylsulfatase A-like enzyme